MFEPMMKFLLLIIGFAYLAIAFSAYPAHPQDCSGMIAYMIKSNGQCVNLDQLQNQLPVDNPPAGREDAIRNNAIDNAAVNDFVGVNVTPEIKANAPLLLKNGSDRSADHKFPPQKTLRTIVVDHNRTFLAAIQQLKAGDRVLVRNGVYQSSRGDEIVVTAEGTADNWAVIAAYPGEQPQIKNTLRLKGAAYVEIYGFELVGPNPITDPSGSGIAVTQRAHDIRLIENTIHDVPGGGIEVKHADYLYIESNRIYNSAWGWIPEEPDSSYGHSAISFYQLMNAVQSRPEIRNIVRGNVVFNVYNTKPFFAGDTITDGNCFILDDTKYTLDREESVIDGYSRPYDGTTLVENNLCVNNGGRGIHAFVSNNLIARNNTLYKNGKTPGLEGELSASSSGNIRFYNNIIYAEPTSRAIVNYKSNDVLIEDNLLFGSNIIDRGIGRLIKADPLFVNADTDLNIADFSLRQNSPAIGAGSNENCSESYFDGTPRIASCDLGAFPFVR